MREGRGSIIGFSKVASSSSGTSSEVGSSISAMRPVNGVGPERADGAGMTLMPVIGWIPQLPPRLVFSAVELLRAVISSVRMAEQFHSSVLVTTS